MIKKILFPAVAAALLLAGCASSPKKETKAADKIPVVIGAEGVPRPQWVMSGNEGTDGIYAVGYAKLSTQANSLTAARTNGRAELLRMVQTTLKSAVTTYAQDAGVAADALAYMEQATVDRAAGILQGSAQKDYWVGADNTVYILMFLPFKAVVPAANNIVDEYVTDKKTEITEEKVAEALKKYQLINSAGTDSQPQEKKD
jgi:hypothetical protein